MKNITLGSYLLALIALLPWTIGKASPHGYGRVKMQGAIVDAACTISTESREQIIDLGILPILKISRDKQGVKKPFSIKLENCVLTRPNPTLSDWKKFQVTFDGQAKGLLFELQGEAVGVALKITNAAGHVAEPGLPLPQEDIPPEEMRLNYFITLVANEQPLRAGTYFTSVRFKLDYF